MSGVIRDVLERHRAEIEDDPRDPQRILTVRGVGYVLTLPRK